MNFLYGMLTATVVIIAAEIKFRYSLGDKVADIFRNARQKAEAADEALIRAKVKANATLRAINRAEAEAVKDQVKYIAKIGEDL